MKSRIQEAAGALTGKRKLRDEGKTEKAVEKGGRVIRSHFVQASIKLPKAFSVSHAPEFRVVQDLVARLNPKLLVAQVATGMHVNGGPTVNWGIVYLDGQPPTHKEAQAALKQAGLDFQHNAQIQPSRIWVNNQSAAIEGAPA